MKHADTLIRINDNEEEEIWYSDDYIQKQIELAYQAGIASGLRVEFHAMEPNDVDMVKEYISLFWKLLDEEYEAKFKQGHVWKQVK